MERKEATVELARLVKAFNDALTEAESFATEHKLSFRIDPSYGMGGTFDGESVGEKDEWGEESDGWFASSQSC